MCVCVCVITGLQKEFPLYAVGDSSAKMPAGILSLFPARSLIGL